MIDDLGYATDPDDDAQMQHSSWSEYTHTEFLDGAKKRVSGFLGWLGEALLGPKCSFCGERWYGPRTLARHVDREHDGDDF